jgi:hypothetical protein
MARRTIRPPAGADPRANGIGVRDLRGCGLSVRDAAHVMMVSTSWVNKLLKQSADE